MQDALQQLGVKCTSGQTTDELMVDGTGRRQLLTDDPAGNPAEFFVANSGTTIRFLTAYLSALGGDYRLHGVARMHQRPLGELVTALASIVDGIVQTESPNGCPPVRIRSHGWHGGTISVGGQISSQYLSGLLLAAPLSDRDCRIEVTGQLVSQPYVRMTCKIVQDFGVDLRFDPDLQWFEIPAGAAYQSAAYEIEPDASAASYFWAAAAITGGRVTVQGLRKDALQGDVAFVDVLQQMGCNVTHQSDGIAVQGGSLRGVDVDMNAISDTVQTLAVVALFAEGPTHVRGVAHNRFKETDRIADLACELRKLGARANETSDGLSIFPLTVQQIDRFAGATLKTYHDHRMAMSLALAGLRLPQVQIENPACTAKTYPEFFFDLETLLGRPHHWKTAPA